MTPRVRCWHARQGPLDAPVGIQKDSGKLGIRDGGLEGGDGAGEEPETETSAATVEERRAMTLTCGGTRSCQICGTAGYYPPPAP